MADLCQTLQQSQTGLIVERLKKQIEQGFAEFEKRNRSKKQHIRGLALENTFQVEVSLLAKMNNQSSKVRSQVGHPCNRFISR